MSEKKTRYFEFRTGKSSKFWEMSWDGGTSFAVRYGKIGTDGRTSIRSFASADEAKAAANGLMNAKHAKGYEYVPEGPAKVVVTTSEVAGTVEKIFADYEEWFRNTYSVADGAEEDESWSRPFKGLKPLKQQQLARLEDDLGVLPQSYRDLVLHIGVGTLMIAAVCERQEALFPMVHVDGMEALSSRPPAETHHSSTGG